MRNDVAPGRCFYYVLIMTENVQSMMLDTLKRIQTDLAGLKVDGPALKTDMEDVKARLDRIEVVVRKQSRDSAALLVMMRGTVGDFDERVSNLEEEVRLIRERERD